MTIPTSKQKKIIGLAQQGLSIPDIAKETSTSYKTAKKYAGMSTTPQPQPPAPQQSVIDGRSPKFAPPKPKRDRDTTRSYASYENVPYYRPVRVAPPSFREPLEEPQQAKPTPEQKPSKLAKPEKLLNHEQLRFSERQNRGIPVPNITEINRQRKLDYELSEWIRQRKQKMEDRHRTVMQDIYTSNIEASQQRDKAERKYWDIYYDSNPKKSKVLPVLKEELSNVNKQDNEINKRIMHGLGEISKNQDEYYISSVKKKQNIKIILDLLPEGIEFLSSLRALYLAVKKRRKPVQRVLTASTTVKAKVIKIK